MGDKDWNGENPWKSGRGIDYARPIKVLPLARGLVYWIEIDRVWGIGHLYWRGD